MIIADRGRHTAIIVKQTPTTIKVVAMQPGPLVITRMDEEELTADWGELVGYPLTVAIVKYLQHPEGVSPPAKKALEDLLMEQL